ncbi:MAG: hypothetical protein LC732_00335 [Acidobacteria bacterium]|nr:hypothetical protein [Acidobacteriota bacterium]
MRAILLVLLLLASPSDAAQIRATAERDGEAVPAAEICAYAAAPGDPFLALAGSKISCYDPREPIEMPDGAFALVARAPGLISAQQPFVSPASGPEEEIAELRLPLVAAAPLDLSSAELGETRRIALILDETAGRGSRVMPLPRGSTASIPTGVSLVPLLLEGEGDATKILAVGGVVRAETGERVVADWSASGGTSVLVRFASDSEEETDLAVLSRIEPPVVRIRDAAGVVHAPLIAAGDPSHLFDAVFPFRGVGPGAAVIRLEGPRWVAKEVPIVIPESGRVLTPEPIAVEPGARLTLLLDATLPLPKTVPTCDAADSEPTDSQLVLLSCPGEIAESMLAPMLVRRCREVASRDAASPEPDAFEGLAPGSYLLATSRGTSVANMQLVRLVAGEDAEVDMKFADRYVAGRVTKSGEPVQATVRFRTGSGVSDPATGEYFALLTSSPRSAAVDVIGCDDSFVYVHTPEREIPLGPGYDLEIPDNRLDVEVVDTVTGAAVSEAMVVAAIVADESGSPTRAQIPADVTEDGYSIPNLEDEVFVRACGSKAGYRQGCSEVIRIERKSQSVRLELRALDRKGRVVGGGYQQIFWVRPDGTILESARIDEKGEFTFAGAEGEHHLVLIGTSPMWVTPPPRLSEQGELELTAPGSAGRAVQVALAEANPARNAVVLLRVNDLPVPLNVLGLHQRMRGQSWLIADRAPLLLDGLPAARIAIAQGPDPDVAQGILDEGRPVYPAGPWQVVAGGGVVLP